MSGGQVVGLVFGLGFLVLWAAAYSGTYRSWHAAGDYVNPMTGGSGPRGPHAPLTLAPAMSLAGFAAVAFAPVLPLSVALMVLAAVFAVLWVSDNLTGRVPAVLEPRWARRLHSSRHDGASGMPPP